MPERTRYAAGTPNWIDLQTSDPSGTSALRNGGILQRCFRDIHAAPNTSTSTTTR